MFKVFYKKLLLRNVYFFIYYVLEDAALEVQTRYVVFMNSLWERRALNIFRDQELKISNKGYYYLPYTSYADASIFHLE
jgi:hypothetical protein